MAGGSLSIRTVAVVGRWFAIPLPAPPSLTLPAASRAK